MNNHKTPRFNESQCVKIENKEQFDEIYHVLRSAQRGISLQEWLRDIYKNYPKFPIYLEHCNSTFSGHSIGFTYTPKNTFSNQDYEILSFEQATF